MTPPEGPRGDPGASSGAPRFAQGDAIRDCDPQVLADAIEAAFDYRGDVTLYLENGVEVRGYLANRDGQALEPYVDLHPADGSAPMRIPYARVQGLAFSGRDTAAGKSWETWVAKYLAKKEARARGDAVEDLGLFPESIEG